MKTGRVLFGQPKSLPIRSAPSRRGASALLIVALLFTFVVVAAVTVDYAYIQLVRTELRVATDAAAKAGAEALGRTEDTNQAIETAIQYAAFNNVAGNPLQLSADEIILGRVVEGNSGRWEFEEDATPFNSMRVNSHVNPPLFFGRLLGRERFSPGQTAVAGQQQVDVVLCLDRSGSMLFDMSGVEYAYPPNNPNLMSNSQWNAIRNNFNKNDWDVWRNHLSPPHPTNSRWAVLSRAVNDFFTEVKKYNPPPNVSLVTWSSDYTMPVTPGTKYTAAQVDAKLPTNDNFNAQQTLIQSKINNLGSKAMMGATNLSAGLDLAVHQVTVANPRTLTNKIVILLTDGQWNDGRNPVLAAQDARDANVTVHTVTMLTAFQPDIQQVANTTGGMSFTTQSEAQLRKAFRDIAKSLQIVIIE